MKIVSIEAIPCNLPSVRSHKLAMAPITEHTFALVRIRDPAATQQWMEKIRDMVASAANMEVQNDR